MADADTTSDVLLRAGFRDVTFVRWDEEIPIGRDLEAAIELVMTLGPAGEILRLAGDRAAHLHPQVDAALRSGMADFVGADGVSAPASTWIVTARNPG
jgi:hypothetical protein